MTSVITYKQRQQWNQVWNINIYYLLSGVIILPVLTRVKILSETLFTNWTYNSCIRCHSRLKEKYDQRYFMNKSKVNLPWKLSKQYSVTPFALRNQELYSEKKRQQILFSSLVQ